MTIIFDNPGHPSDEFGELPTYDFEFENAFRVADLIVTDSEFFDTREGDPTHP